MLYENWHLVFKHIFLYYTGKTIAIRGCGLWRSLEQDTIGL